jgi:ABC-type Fe3+-hydroxamate transport system substrate-binding protein
MGARVVSLIPSMTETLLDWGVTPVACTRFCEQPQLPHVGGTKDPEVDAIVALRPDLVILDVEENRREDHDALVAEGVQVHVVRIRSVDDIAPQLEPLAERLGVHWRTPTVDVPPRSRQLAAFVPIWKRPWMALGAPTYGTSVLERLGITNIFTEGDGAYPETTLEEAAHRRPDLVLAPSEPYPFAERHRPQLEVVAPVVFVDGKDLVWWGSRTAPALRRLAEALP